MPSGGYRPNAGRKPEGKVRLHIVITKATYSKIEKSITNRFVISRGEVIDEWAKTISVPGLEYLDLVK